MLLTDDQIKQISEQTNPDDLPGDLVEIAELLGTYKALLLGYHAGCGRIYLKPWSDDPETWSIDVKLIRPKKRFKPSPFRRVAFS